MPLVFKVTEPGSHHRDAVLVAVVEGELVLDASARLDDGKSYKCNI